jgi:hypothetical protein
VAGFSSFLCFVFRRIGQAGEKEGLSIRITFLDQIKVILRVLYCAAIKVLQALDALKGERAGKIRHGICSFS